MKISKSICLLQIGAQFFYSLLGVYTFSFEAIADTAPLHTKTHAATGTTPQPHTQDTASATAGDMAGIATQAGSLLQSDTMRSTLVSGATGKAAQSVEDWLSQFGTARVSASADENMSLEQLELDVLLPIYDDKTNLLFTQLGSRRADERNIINTGIGYRHFSSQWMWGANTFYDRQISENHHQRLGIGGELGWDYLKVSANSYLRLSDWMASSRYENYDERAANGFDIRTEGYLPAYPQLGASIMFEKYFGDNVDLFNDEDNRQKDPYAVTVGLNYTPFTLVTAGVSQKMGKGDTQDTQFNLSFSYAPSVSMDKQLDPSQVAVRRSLLGSRQDLVNRNNTIVLDYRKQDLISLGLPDKIQGVESVTLPISAVINSKYGLDHIDWQDDDLKSHGGNITQDTRSGQYSITLPRYQFGGSENHYIVSGKAVDAKGNGSNLSQMNVYVTGSDAVNWQSTAAVSPASLLADGSSTSTVSVNILNSSGQAVTGMASQLSATVKLTPSLAPTSTPVQNPAISAFKETSPGTYTSTFTSGNVAGTAEVIPMANGQTVLPSASIVLHSTDTTASLSTLTASKTSVLANGTDSVQLTVKVLNVEGQPYKGVTVSWNADSADAALSANQSISDENGLATLNVSSLKVLNTTITASLDGGETLNSDLLSFGADMSTAQVMGLSTDKTQAVADNLDNVTLTANVVNAQNQPLNGAPVNWKVEQGSAVLSISQGTTDASGNAQITVASSVAGSVVVSARSGTTDAKNTDAITFAADSAHMSISSLTQDKAQALANGNDAVTYLVIVADVNGNKVTNALVTFSSDSAIAKLSGTTVNTDAQGQATLHVTSTTAGTVVISAKLPTGTATKAPVATFTADASTARLSNVIADKTQVLANGTDRITLKTSLTDANGNPLVNTDVNWSTSPANGTLSNSSTKTDAQGMAVVTLASSTVNSYVVTASADGVSAASPSLIFAADTATATITSLVADKTSGVVAGVDSVKMQAVVLDASGHPVPNVTVNWSSDNSSGQFTPASGLTDINGVATAQFTETKAQATSITAAIANSSKKQSIDVIANASTAQLSSVEVSKSQALANGTDTVTWTVTVKDANQNPLNNAAVNWSRDDTNVALKSSSTQTNASGVATVSATSSKTADVIVTAALATPAVSAKANKVSYVADASTTQFSAVTADKTQALANGRDLITLTTTLTDANGNPLINTDVSWSSNPATGTLSAGSTKTNASGMATVTLSSNAVDSYTVTAQANGKSKASSTLSFTADASSAHLASLTADKTAGVVAGKDTVTLTATLLDANNHPVPGSTVNWSSDNSSGKFTPVSGVTDANGIATVKFTATKAQTTVVTATAAGGSKTQSIEVIADASTAQMSSVTTDKSQAVANGTDAISWTTTIKDANQNPVNNMVVNWSSDNKDVGVASSSTQTNASGVATVKATSTKTADAVMTAAILSPASSVKASKVSYIADVSTTQLSDITANKVKALGNGEDFITLSTVVTDANGNPLVNADVNWSTNPATGTLSAGSTKTDAQGKASVMLSSLSTGNATVTASVNSASKTSPTLTFTADASTALLTTLVADKTAAVVAGKDTVTLTATVLDDNQHPVQDAMVTWSSDNASGTFTTVSGKTNASGIATATYTAKKAQVSVITATTTGNSKTQSIEFIADVSTAKLSGVTSDKIQALANGKEMITWSTTVNDANQNPIANTQVKWSSDNANITLATGSTNTGANGTATVTATSIKAVDTVMTAAITSPAGSAKAAKVSYIADASTTRMSALTADKTTALANGTDLITLSTTVTDINGNPLVNADVGWSSSPKTGTLSDTTSKTDAQGKATVTLSSLTLGDYAVTATANSATATSTTLTFSVDAATATITTLTADKTAGLVAGVDSVALQATVLDASNHPVPNVTVNWSSDNANGLFTPVSGVTDANGVVKATMSSTLAQTTVITVSTTNSQKTLSTEFVANAQTAQITLVADKAQVVANGADTAIWKATVLDANNNPVKAQSVDWKSDSALVTLAGTNNQTSADGTALMTATSLKSGTAILTATLIQRQLSASATVVTYIGDIATAQIVTLTASKASVYSNKVDNVTYTATTADINGNLLTGTTLNWAATINTLSATTSVIDSKGVAVVSLSGNDNGNATLTASLGGTSRNNGDVEFIDSYTGNWTISNATSNFTTPWLPAHAQSGFVVVAPTTGPTTIASGSDGTSSLTAPMKDASGNVVTVNFGGQRVSYCNAHAFNLNFGCASGPLIYAKLSYSVSDNPDLPPGVYTGDIDFDTTPGYGTYDIPCKVHVVLTVL